MNTCTKYVATMFIATTLAGCGGGSSSGGNESGNTTRSDFGLYVTDNGTDTTPFSVTLTKNGTMIVAHNENVDGSIPIALTGFTVVSSKTEAIDHEFYVYDTSRTQKFTGNISIPHTGGNLGEVLPFQFSVSELDINISDLFVYYPTEDIPNDHSLLNKNYIQYDGYASYEYLGDRRFTIRHHLTGCEVTSIASNSGLSNPEQSHYDIKVLSSNCETDAHSTGLLSVTQNPFGYILSASIQIKDKLIGFGGLAID
ncbi:hypothetical protein C9I99_05445 [Photobacterium lutimaris]|uniref:Lipoprotein n=2 Tax=Photobacterium lutimaris TaxID=388278 RepID=A0A2T3J569_9GAMM|nr:hypothetical protein C9I99_05445 [Photobacterium lutimaris]TDR69939.1 hypothetical protein DFP78_12610 [Photobacterium lutimaris]